MTDELPIMRTDPGQEKHENTSVSSPKAVPMLSQAADLTDLEAELGQDKHKGDTPSSFWKEGSFWRFFRVGPVVCFAFFCGYMVGSLSIPAGAPEPTDTGPQMHVEAGNPNDESAHPRPLKISVYSHVYDSKGHRADTNETCAYWCQYVANDDPQHADVVQADITHGKLPTWRKPEGQRWIGHYLESPEHRPFPFDASYMAHFDYTYGFRPDSTFVKHLLIGNREAWWDDIVSNRNMREFPTFVEKAKKEMMSVWISNCGMDKSHRLPLLRDLVKHGVTIASFGACENNKGRDKRDKVEESEKYRFLFAAENSRYPYYHSEKMFQAYYARTLPVYIGSHTIEGYVPADSYIYADDFATSKDLAQYIVKVANNETLYASYFEFQKKKLPDYIASKVEYQNRTQEKKDCDMCTYLHTHGPATAKPLPRGNEEGVSLNGSL